MKPFSIAFFTIFFSLLTVPSVAQHVWREGEFRGTVILTITGNIALPTRAGSAPDVDKFFSYNDVSFDKATQFDVAALQALPQTTLNADFPKGGTVSAFEGPLLSDVLRIAGAEGKIATFRALDGYGVEIPIDEAEKLGAVLALKRDGIPFAIGDFGPIQLVFPRAQRIDLADMNDDWWVWSVYSIQID